MNGEGAARVDDLAGRQVEALAPDGDGWWALVEDREVWRSADRSRWSMSAKVPKRKATCLATTPAALLVGTARAHLLRFEADRLVPMSSFDEAEGRDAWYTPWGAPADVRSISAGADGALYVNVHVGGVLRSVDGGAAWRPTLDIEHDVRQVLVPPDIRGSSSWPRPTASAGPPTAVTPGNGRTTDSTRTTVAPWPSPAIPCSSAHPPATTVAGQPCTGVRSTAPRDSTAAGSGCRVVRRQRGHRLSHRPGPDGRHRHGGRLGLSVRGRRRALGHHREGAGVRAGGGDRLTRPDPQQSHRRRCPMAIHIDHVIVPSHNKVAAAKSLAGLLGVPWQESQGPSPPCT